MFRVAFLAFAFFALGALVFGGAEAAVGLLAIPFLVLKFALIVLLFGAIFGMMSHKRSWTGGPQPPWVRHRRPRPDRAEPTPSAEDRFEEWHRMAHAKDEVDGWVPDEL